MFELSPPEDDGLPIPSVGWWSRDKHHFLMRYIDAFTTAMKSKGWSGLHYIDLFAGPGIERVESSGRLHWGSPLIAAQAPHAFDGLHVCELNEQKFTALKIRLMRVRPDAQILNGDANVKIHEIINEIPAGSLSLAFLDPYGLHLDFDTLRVLASKRTDLIIFFPDHLDALRNCNYVYKNDPNSNLDRVLGCGTNWRSVLDSTPKHRWAEALRKLYEKQIQTLGYTVFEYERIPVSGRQLYLLVFCSRDRVAGRIWRGISKKKPDNQQTFEFPPLG